MAYPVYGPIVYIVDKFVPTAILIELLKDLKYYGDTIIGDRRKTRRLQKEIRKAAVKRMEINNQDMVQEILNGDWDHKLDQLQFGEYGGHNSWEYEQQNKEL